jgi:ethanolamine phosphate phosphodiesterase
MTRHIRRPGFELLSVTDPSEVGSGKSLANRHCLLPDPYGIYKGLYLPLSFVTVIALIVINLRRFKGLGRIMELPPPLLPRSSSSSTRLHLSPKPSASGAWSPYTQAVPVSPRSSLPSSLRTPNPNSEPSLRSSSASHPSTPMSTHTPMFSPPLYQNQHEDEDGLLGSQYATVPTPRTGVSPDDSWSPDHEPDTATRLNFLNIRSPFYEQSEFVFHPGQKPKSERWSASWTFAFRGRMRRITLRVPTLSWEALKDLVGLLEGQDADVKLKRRGAWKSAGLDVMSVAWIAILTWWAITWRTF